MRTAGLLGAFTLAAWTVGYIRPGYRLGAATSWGLFLLVYGLVWSGLHVRGLVRRGKSPYDQILHSPAHSRARPPDLVRCERIYGRSVYTPGDFDHAVRPLLRSLIRHRLVTEHRGAAEGDPFEAGMTIDAELDSLVGTESAEGLYGRNLKTADIDRMLRGIEAIGTRPRHGAES